MRNLKLLNKKYFSIILVLLLIGFSSKSEEPVDIWNIEEKKTKEDEVLINQTKESNSKNKIYEMQSEKQDLFQIEQDFTLTSKEIEIVGLYDPAENGLDIKMWSNSDGNKIINLFNNINNINLSNDASEILEILLLTNAYYPDKSIGKKDFFNIKSSWLIKNSNLLLIEEFLVKNQIINQHPKLTRYLVDEYLSR